MYRLLNDFQKSIIFFGKVLLLVSCFALFYSFFATDSEELRRGFNRVSAIISTSFFIVGYIIIKIYGGIRIGSRQSREIILSASISMIFIDIFTFVQLCIMEKRIISALLFIPVVILQIFAVSVFCVILTRFFYYVNPPEKLLILFDNRVKLEFILLKLKAYKNKFSVGEICEYDKEELYSRISGYNSIMLVDVPSEAQECIVEYCYKRGKNVFFTPNIADIAVSKSNHMFIDDISMFSFKRNNLSAEQKIVKRIFDLIVSLLGFIVLLPLLIIIMAFIKIADKGPIFYKQKRVTEGGKAFTLLKFRTMIVDAEKCGAVLAQKDDKRITKAGRILRKTRLDELPQLINIIKGDMSIVGPRPERPDIAAMYEKDIPEFGYRLTVKAGLTGFAQVNGRYNTTPSDKLFLDLMYIENYSFRLDLKIIFQTAVVCLSPEKAC